MPTVSRLNVAPVKATRLLHPTEIWLGPHGVAIDRRFFFIDMDGRRLSGTQYSQLAAIQSSYDPVEERLQLTFPDGTSVTASATAGDEPIALDYYGRPVHGRVVHGPWEEALSRYVGHPAQLVRCEQANGVHIRPVTLVSTASVEELSRKAGRAAPVDAGRFRMLVEIDGCTPHEEDTWQGGRVRLGAAVVRVGKPVPRCVVTTRNSSTGTKDLETLAVIAAYRGTSEDGDLPFGVYADVEEPGTVRTGDAVEPLD